MAQGPAPGDLVITKSQHHGHDDHKWCLLQQKDVGTYFCSEGRKQVERLDYSSRPSGGLSAVVKAECLQRLFLGLRSSTDSH